MARSQAVAALGLSFLVWTGCNRLRPLPLDGTQSDGGPADLAVADKGVVDLAAGDLAARDLRVVDLTATTDLTPVATAPSCTGLARTCGPAHDGDCCESLLVTGGSFYRGYDVAADGYYPDNSNPASVSDFRLDKYEVTVGRFRAFINAGQGTRANPPSAGSGSHALIANSGWASSWDAHLAVDGAALVAALKSCDPLYTQWTDSPGANENRPINCVNWIDAMAFCAWDEGFLPTEAEWNYAAAGGSEQRAYPWSNPPGSTFVDDTYAVYYCDGCLSPRDVGAKSPKGDGKWGQSDLVGNVFEWALDSYGSYPNPCNDCASLVSSRQVSSLIKGGSFSDNSPQSQLRPAARWFSHSLERDHKKGMRCARPK